MGKGKITKKGEKLIKTREKTRDSLPIYLIFSKNRGQFIYLPVF